MLFEGFSVANEKPNVETFINPIIMQLKKLEYGIDLLIENVMLNRKFFLIAGVFDKPAKSMFLNIMSCNGEYGCHICEQPGETFKGKKCSVTFDKQAKGSRHIYKFNKSNPKGPLRTEESYQTALKKATVDNHSKGIKGISLLSCLKYYKPISSTCIDFMHSLLEGAIKNLLCYWFDSEFSTSAYSLRKYMQEIDNRLLSITPPKFVPRTPRSIYCFNLWHAHEYLSFIIYYSLAVFRDIMQANYYSNLKKLILFMEIILSPSINKNDLRKAETVVFEFVEELQELYPPSIMLSGVHEMLHLVDCTFRFGPLNTINCFQYEELNRKLIGFIHGYDLIGEELIKIFSTAQVLGEFSNSVKNNALKEYIQEKLIFKTSNRKRLNYSNDIKPVDKPTKSFSPQYIKLFTNYAKKNIKELSVFEKVSFNGIVFTSEKLKTKRCDSAFVNKNNEYGLIQSFIIEDKTVYVIAKRLVSMFNAYSFHKYPELRTTIYACHLSNQLFIEKLTNIRKVVLIKTSDNNIFVSLFNSSHLFS